MVVEDFGGLAHGHRKGFAGCAQLLFLEDQAHCRVLTVLQAQQLIEQERLPCAQLDAQTRNKSFASSSTTAEHARTSVALHVVMLVWHSLI